MAKYTRCGGLERARGIEPLSSDWKSEVLPLHNARACLCYMASAGRHASPICALLCHKFAKFLGHKGAKSATTTRIGPMKRHVFALLTAAFSIAGTAAQAEVHEIRILREGYFPATTYL